MTIKELKEIMTSLPEDMPVYVVDSNYGPEESGEARIEEVPENIFDSSGRFTSSKMVKALLIQ